MNLLEVKNIKKSFDDLEVLKDISMSVAESEVISILGPSGSGKSTFLRCMTMLEKIDGGSMVYCGKEAVNSDRRRSDLCRQGRLKGDPELLRTGIPEL